MRHIQLKPQRVKTAFFYLTYLVLFLMTIGTKPVQAEEWQDSARNLLTEIRPQMKATAPIDKEHVRQAFVQELKDLSPSANPMRFDAKMNTTTAATMALSANRGDITGPVPAGIAGIITQQVEVILIEFKPDLNQSVYLTRGALGHKMIEVDWNTKTSRLLPDELDTEPTV